MKYNPNQIHQPCPFCGNSGSIKKRTIGWFVCCARCKAQGPPTSEEPMKAAEMWNKSTERIMTDVLFTVIASTATGEYQGNIIIPSQNGLITKENIEQAKKIYCEKIKEEKNITIHPAECMISFFHKLDPKP